MAVMLVRVLMDRQFLAVWSLGLSLFLAFTQAPAALAATDELVFIQGGAFMMGSPADEMRRGKDEVRHRVVLSGFHLAPYEVTQREYREIMKASPSNFSGDALPVENVAWYEAVLYCNERSKKEGLTPAYVLSGSEERPVVAWNRSANGYRLPTEAEWEYACRAGSLSPFNTGGNISAGQTNYYGRYPYNNAPSQVYREKTVPVGSFAPNAWGLYDMHGNVWEWCWDVYGEYAAGEQKGPAGAEAGALRVNRGGGWNDFGRHLRSAYRAAHNPENRTFNIGFRVARNAG